MPNLSKSPLITTGLLWIIAGLIAWPMGDFPLDDDWSYAEAVKHWVDTSTYWVSDWPAMTLFTQVIWGGVFAKVFGFSFTILRWSTLVIGAIGIWAFRQTLVQLKFPDHWQLLVLLTLVFNPLFFELSFTFMTDIPFLSLMAIALYAYLNAFETNQFKWWAAATLACILSVLLRQMALLLPICMGIALLLGKPRLQSFGWALGSTLLTYLSLKGYVFWQEHTPTGLPAAFGKPEQLLSILSWDYISGKVSQLSGLYLLYLGGMLLPVSLLTAWRPRQPIALGLSLLATGAGLIAIKHSWAEPLLGNTINQWGLGTTPLAGDR
ncbi:MAG: glycosyltransferase family 39 protein, partial [Mameliella sp.]|nr:glycosyltransferase family 39 protein [Phaeodactylibacter sp.]